MYRSATITKLPWAETPGCRRTPWLTRQARSVWSWLVLVKCARVPDNRSCNKNVRFFHCYVFRLPQAPEPVSLPTHAACHKWPIRVDVALNTNQTKKQKDPTCFYLPPVMLLLGIGVVSLEDEVDAFHLLAVNLESTQQLQYWSGSMSFTIMTTCLLTK